MRANKFLRFGVAGLVVSGVTLVTVDTAFGDYQPQSSDVVGVGGDTAQYAVGFAADGDIAGDPGFNAAGGVNRLVTFSATADANGRTAYANGSTESAPIALNPTVVLRAGTSPVQRVTSSGAALTAFLADTAKNINFIFSSSEPTAAQQATANSNGWNYLHVVEIGTDAVEIAADTTTNAPTGLSTADLLGIYKGTYTAWNQIPGNSSGSSATIIPLLPPTSSSITKTFLASLKTANGGIAPVLASTVQTVEQNDPSAITASSSPANAIVPFSSARLALWNTGYFHNPATAYPGGASLTPGVSLLTATNPIGAASYSAPVTDYVIFRQTDATSPTPFEPGGTRNWVQTLFSNPGGTAPFFQKASTQSLLAASGITPNYVDLGDVSSG